MRIEIDAAGLPYDASVLEFAAAHQLPAPAFLFRAGRENTNCCLPRRPKKGLPRRPTLRRHAIGKATLSSDSGLFLQINGESRPIVEPPPCPREHTDQGDYIQAILSQVQHVFG